MGDESDGLLRGPAYSCQGNSFCLVAEQDVAGRCISSIAGRVKTDGLLVVGKSSRADVRIRLFERDGTESDLCGNGILCMAYHLSRRRAGEWTIEMGGEVHRATVRRNRVTADFAGLQNPACYIGTGAQYERCSERLVRFRYRGECMYFVNSGEPHLFLLLSDPARLDAHVYKPMLSDPTIFPRGTNFDLLTTRPPFRIRTFERGVNAFTGSCGTGSVAAAQLLVLLGESALSEFAFHSDGGVHEVRLDGNQVYLSGRVRTERRYVLTAAGGLTSGNKRRSAARSIC